MRSAAAWLAGVLAAAPAVAEPLCRAEVVLEPTRAFVGQPVRHRVRITKRHEVVDLRWETSLSFPAFRAERILGPGGPVEQSAEGETVEERRVLFPARAGRLALPAARLACEGAGRVETAPVPASELVVAEPPAAGRPAGWTGLIGPVEVNVQATPDRVELGGAVVLSVVVQGETNVWAAPVAFRFPPSVAELFERPSQLARDMGRSLSLRWYRAFDLVPRRAGTLEIPSLVIPYFDPATGRYAEARAPALSVTVDEPVATSTPAPATPAEPAPAARAPERSRLGAWLVLALGLAGGLALAWRRRRRRSEPAGGADPAPEREALERALAAGDATAAGHAAARLLRLVIEPELAGARSLAVEEIAARAPARSRPRVALLTRLERARFAGADDATLLALAGEARDVAR